MIRTITSILLMTFAAACIQYFLPWWTMVIACSIVAFVLKLTRFQAWAAGFIGIFLLWFGMSMYSDRAFDVPMSGIIGGIFGDISSSATYTLTGIIGAIVGSLGGWLGASFVTSTQSKNIIKSKKGYYKFT